MPPTPTDYELNAAGLATGEFVTANCFCRKDVLAAIGGFDPRFTMAWREDSDLHFALLEHCIEPQYVADAVVVHPVRVAGWGVSLRQQRKSMFNALLYEKHPDAYSERIQPAPPWHYYRMTFVLLLAIVGLLRGQRKLALAGVVSWLWMTGGFCARRLHGTSHAPRHVAEMLVTSAAIPPVAVFWRLYGAFRFRVFFL